jgi:hypothetical protein
VRERYMALSPPEKRSIISFLKTLRAPAVDPAEQPSKNLAAR